MPCELWHFLLLLVWARNLPGPVRDPRDCFLWSSWIVLFSALGTDHYSAEYARAILYRPVGFSLLMYSPMKTLEPWGLDRTVPSSLSPQLRKTTGILLSSFSFPVPKPGNSLQPIYWSHHRVHLICFPSFWEHCPSMSDVHCLEKLCFVYLSIFSVVLSRKTNLVPVIPSWL